MGYATVMVQLELGRSNTAPLAVARDLARRLDASVSGVAAAQPIQAAVMADGFYGSDIVREDNQCLEEEAAAAEAEFRKELGGHPEGLDWHMSVTMQPLSVRISAAAGPADILVAGIDRQGLVDANPSRHVDIGDLIMQVGRPVLAVPPGIERFDFRCALVAWKDTRESRRALADSLPLLRLMDKVVIAQVGDASEQEAVQAGLARMAGWLGRHGVSAISRFVLAGGDDAERLLAVAKGEGADLIVAGAYGHSRLRQWVLGGVTRTLLTKGGRCLLLSH